MNHLAHCLLSFNNESLLIGNFIGDFVKGNAWEKYSPSIQKGILLHREIDAFTDAHPVVKSCAAQLKPYAGRFAPPIVDILFDHLLAISWTSYSHIPFQTFTQTTYQQLSHGATSMPPILQERLPRMIAGDFLSSYLTYNGLFFVFQQFSKRLPFPLDYPTMLEFFFSEKDVFLASFNAFFPELLEKAKIYSNFD
jgi:acyl carrier protein phosphodiesterase